MCVLSAVIHEGSSQWPWYPSTPPLYPSMPNITVSPPVEIPMLPTAEEWAAFKELCDKARQFDEIVGLADCEKPELVVWMNEVDRRLKELEGPEPGVDKADHFLKAVQKALNEIP